MKKKLPADEISKPVPVCLNAAYREKALALGDGNLSKGVRVAIDGYCSSDDRTREIWAAAQLAPGESMADGMLRIAAILSGDKNL